MKKTTTFLILFVLLFSACETEFEVNADWQEVTVVYGVLLGFGLILLIAPLAVLLPTLAVSVRRLHDTGRSGWWMLLGMIPLVNCVGGIVLLLFFVMEGNSHVNAYGDVPPNVVE